MLPPIHLLADVAGVLDVADRTEIRTRTPGEVAGTTSIDLETVPSATAVLTTHHTLLSLGYFARVSELDANVIGGNSPTLFQTGTIAGAWRTSKLELSLAQSLGYGQVNFAGPAAIPAASAGGATGNQAASGNGDQTTGPATTTGATGAAGTTGTNTTSLNNVPVERSPYTLSSTSLLTMAAKLKKWQLTMDVGYQLTGGATEQDRYAVIDGTRTPVLPIERGPRGDALVTYTASHHDQEYTAAIAQRLDFVDGPSNGLLTAREGWRHQFTSRFSSDINAGFTVSESRLDATSPNVGGIYPTGRLTLQYLLPSGTNHISFVLTGGTDATVDRLLGTVDQRVDSALTASLARRRIAVHADAVYTQSIDQHSPDSIQLFYGDVGTSWLPSKYLTVDAGFRAGFQKQVVVTGTQTDTLPNATSNIFQSSVYLAVTVRSPTVHF